MNYNRAPLAVFFSYFRPHIALFAADMMCASIAAAMDTAYPMISRYAVNALIGERDAKRFLCFVSILAAVYLLRGVFSWFIGYWGHLFGAHVECDMRRDVFARLEEQSFAFYDAHRTGHLMSRATTDLFEITELAHHGPEDVLISLLTLVLSFFMLLKIRAEMAAIVFSFLFIFIAVTFISRSRLASASRKVKDVTSALNAELESSISGVRVTKSFTNEEHERARFQRGNGEYYTAKKCFYRTMSSFHASIDCFYWLLNILVLAAGGTLIIQGKMTVADLVASNLFIQAFMYPIERLSSFAEQFSTGMAGFNRFLELMRTPSSECDAIDAVEMERVRGDIEFRGVSFCYNNGTAVLNNLDLKIRAGEKFALVGSSGGGKTTLCSLIPRFYEVTSGTVLLDGVDIRGITLCSLRRQIGIVQQDVFLFAGTVKENIAYGRLDATDKEIAEAAKRAQMHEDIMAMPDGYDTLVGERGVRLSGGQKQRISIARCFLKNPPILILDEATSALDTATEAKIQEAFDALSLGRTTLVIAHRLSTVRNADRIAVIDEHGIAQLGTHEELMAQGGEYKALYEAQNRGII